jgi:DNA-binding beta-propeller fold protein YncE
VISPATDTVTATITGPTGEPLAIAADPATDRTYVALYERGAPAQIAVIDGATSTLATTPGGAGADSIATNRDTDAVYLSFRGNRSGGHGERGVEVAAAQLGCGDDVSAPRHVDSAPAANLAALTEAKNSAATRASH